MSWFIGRGDQPDILSLRGAVKYEKPTVQKFGTLRESTLGAGPSGGGDATSIYHRS